MLQKDPDNTIVLFNLGAVQYHAKEYDEALKTFRCVEVLNGPVDYLYYLGMIYKIKGQLNEARYYFQQRWERRTGNNDLYGQRAAQIVANIDQSKNSGR
jgi:tetratricopeptide (TPR) repeat protein